MEYRGKRVLVTGADGFIGSHLAEALAEAGADVTALALYNAFDRHGWLDEIGAEARAAMTLVRGDVRDPHAMLRLAEGQDAVFHLAALIAIPHSYESAQSYVDVNVTGTLNVLEAARAGAVGRVVHTSTSEVYGTARTTPIGEDHPLQGQSPYAASKIAADALCDAYARSFDLPVYVLRPFNTYGPRQSERAVIASTIRQALDPAVGEIAVGDTTTERDFSYVADTVAAFLAAGLADGLEPGRAYNAGSGAAVSIAAMIDAVRKATGANKPLRREAARLRPEKSEVRLLLADSAAFRAATGWRPQTALADGIGATVSWWRERLARGLARPGAGYVR
jgi:NAD dependent epimerase/dehydratase